MEKKPNLLFESKSGRDIVFRRAHDTYERLRGPEAEEAATGKKLFALHARFIEYRNFWGTHRRQNI